MCFKDLCLMNVAHLAKQVWRLDKNQDSLWARVLKSIYYPRGIIWVAKGRKGGPWAWKSIIEGRDMLLKFGRWHVGDGKNRQVDF